MAVEWDYGSVADAYDARPPYAPTALAECLDGTADHGRICACDVGAGTGRLTLDLLGRSITVIAVEPNAAMRAHGVTRTAGRGAVAWTAGVGEALPLADGCCDLVAFGSSFNVVERARALVEAARVLRPGGRLVCAWNHRRLADPLQARVEAAIRAHVPAYAYGVRREDQSEVIAASGLFTRIRRIETEHVHDIATEAWLAAWSSHLTLRRQAGSRFAAVLAAIADVVRRDAGERLQVPYVTRAWVAHRVDAVRDLPPKRRPVPSPS